MKLSYKAHGRAERVFKAVLAHYGPSRHHNGPPRLVLLWEPNFEKVNFGAWWQENGGGAVVAVNFARCRTWRQVVGTIVHEVWHHHQSPNWLDEAAYEAEARRITKRDTGRFLKVR